MAKAKAGKQPSNEIISALDKILEAELSGVVRYLHYSFMIFGPNRIPITKWFRDHAMEGITHSICTLEFEDHRPLYDWVVAETDAPHRPQQIEFARLNLTFAVMSKRKLLELVGIGHVLADGAVGHTGIVDQDIDPTPAVVRLLNHGLALRGLRDIEGAQEEVIVFSDAERGKPVEGFTAGREDESPGPRLEEQQPGQGKPQTGAGAGDQHDRYSLVGVHRG